MTTASCAGATKQRDTMCFWSTAGTPNPPGQAPPDTRQELRSHSSLNPTPLAIFLPRLAACPTPHGRTVNCAPAHRYLGVRLEKGNYPTLSAFFAQMATD